MVGAEKEKVALCAGAYNKNKKNAWCQKRERIALRKIINDEYEIESLSAQANIIKPRKMVGAKKEKAAHLKGLSHEIDLKNFDKNLHNLA